MEFAPLKASLPPKHPNAFKSILPLPSNSESIPWNHSIEYSTRIRRGIFPAFNPIAGIPTAAIPPFRNNVPMQSRSLRCYGLGS